MHAGGRRVDLVRTVYYQEENSREHVYYNHVVGVLSDYLNSQGCKKNNSYFPIIKCEMV
ncbi:hypothetical protein YC2023_098887 [Brassica napus]